MLHLVQVNAINVALGRKVSDFRKAKGWSQAELAAQFGDALGRPMDATTITRLEQGKRPVPVHELIELSHLFGVEPTVFFKFLSPLDDAVKAMQMHSRGLAAKAEVAAIEANAAADLVAHLEALQSYRSSRDIDDLNVGLEFLFAPTQFERADWKEIILAADVDAGAVDEAVRRMKASSPRRSRVDRRIGESEFDAHAKALFRAALLELVSSPQPRRRKTR